MKLKITYLFILLISSVNLMFGQTTINDFENGTTDDALTNVGGGITTEIVDNPNASGDNTTAKVLKIGRNAAQWWVFAGIDVADIAISDTETKFLSFMVYGPKTDLAVRFNAISDDNNGTNGGIIRPSTLHSGEAQWEQIVIPIVDSQTATSFTGGTLFKLVFHPDIADASIVEGGQILNDTDTFLYIDEIKILDSNPLSISNFELTNNISLSPNPASNIFKINSFNNTIIKEVSIYNVLGKQINALNVGTNQFDISSLSRGMYMVKITDDRGLIASKKLFVR
ncbi:T9SS type A sorting domain-containing protein [Polaribacter sp. OB-PA-B3]